MTSMPSATLEREVVRAGCVGDEDVEVGIAGFFFQPGFEQVGGEADDHGRSLLRRDAARVGATIDGRR